MSTRRLRTLGDAMRHGVQLEITCSNAACGRVRLVGPAALLGLFAADASFATIGRRMICRGEGFTELGCGQRGALVRYRFPEPPPPDQPPDGPAPGGGNVIAFSPRRFPPDAQIAPLRRVARGRRRGKLKQKNGPT